MAIPSKQIGWGTEENLLWQISKQLENLTKVVGKVNTSVTVYSSSLSFPLDYTSIRLQCDGGGVDTVYTNQTVNNISEAVALFNSTPESRAWGTYSNLGDSILVLTAPLSVKDNFCPTGVLTLDVFQD